jgi:protein-tyrosine-phosphatase
MAEGFLRALADARFEVESAGTEEARVPEAAVEPVHAGASLRGQNVNRVVTLRDASRPKA